VAFTRREGLGGLYPNPKTRLVVKKSLTTRASQENGNRARGEGVLLRRTGSIVPACSTRPDEEHPNGPKGQRDWWAVTEPYVTMMREKGE